MPLPCTMRFLVCNCFIPSLLALAARGLLFHRTRCQIPFQRLVCGQPIHSAATVTKMRALWNWGRQPKLRTNDVELSFCSDIVCVQALVEWLWLYIQCKLWLYSMHALSISLHLVLFSCCMLPTLTAATTAGLRTSLRSETAFKHCWNIAELLLWGWELKIIPVLMYNILGGTQMLRCMRAKLEKWSICDKSKLVSVRNIGRWVCFCFSLSLILKVVREDRVLAIAPFSNTEASLVSGIMTASNGLRVLHLVIPSSWTTCSLVYTYWEPFCVSMAQLPATVEYLHTLISDLLIRRDSSDSSQNGPPWSNGHDSYCLSVFMCITSGARSSSSRRCSSEQSSVASYFCWYEC